MTNTGRWGSFADVTEINKIPPSGMTITLQDLAGVPYPLRDARGRFRTRTYDEMGLMGRASARLAQSLAEQWAKDAEFFSGASWSEAAGA